MKKIIATVVALICALLIFTNNSSAAQALRDGFRDVKWGDPLEKHPELYAVSIEGNFVNFSKKDDPLNIGEAKLKTITYLFYNSKANGVFITFEEERNFTELKAALIERYGTPLQSNSYIEQYSWLPPSLSSGVAMSLNFSKISNNGFFLMSKMGVLSEIEADEKQRAKDAAKDF